MKTAGWIMPPNPRWIFGVKSRFAGHHTKPGFTLRYITVFAREFMVFTRVVHGVVENMVFYILRVMHGFCLGFYGVPTGFLLVFTVFSRLLHGLPFPNLSKSEKIQPKSLNP